MQGEALHAGHRLLVFPQNTYSTVAHVFTLSVQMHEDVISDKIIGLMGQKPGVRPPLRYSRVEYTGREGQGSRHG